MYGLRLKVLLLSVLLSVAGLCAQDVSPAGQRPRRGRIEPEFVKLQPGAKQQFNAIIEAPLFNFTRVATKATWTVDDVVGGNAQVGTIDANGLYSAPSHAPVPHEVHIRAEVEGLANRYLFATALVGAPEIAYTMTSSWSDASQTHHLKYPHSIALDPQGNVLIADSVGNQVLLFSRDGKFIRQIGGRSVGKRISDGTVHRSVARPKRPGADIGDWGDEPRGTFAGPRDAIADSSGMIYVVDVAERRPMVQVFNPEGQFQYSFGRHGILPGELFRSHGMAFDSKGLLHVEDVENARVETYERNGKFVSSWGHEGTMPGELNAPHGIFIDPNDEVFIIGYYGPVQKFTVDGRYLLSFAAGDPPDHAVSYQFVAGDRWGDVYVPMRTEGLAKYSNTGKFLGWVVKGHSIQWLTVAHDGTVYAIPAGGDRKGEKPQATVEVYSPR